MAAPPVLPEGLAATLQVVRALEAAGARYCLGGSLASSLHGWPRSTLDADLVTDLAVERIDDFLGFLSPGFYVDRDRAEQAIRNRSSFNLIHLGSLFKIDVFALRGDALAEREMERRQVVALEGGGSLFVATAEDILLEKLRWFRLGNEVSQRQWGDVLGVIHVQANRLDLAYLGSAARAAGLSDLLGRAFEEAKRSEREGTGPEATGA